MYPLEGNEKAIGLDYNKNPAQREAALRARDSGSLILAGPVDLVQGGTGFIGRFPVFTGDAFGQREFWGIVSAVVDADRLYADSGLLDPTSASNIALSGDGRSGIAGDHLLRRTRRFPKTVPSLLRSCCPRDTGSHSARPKGGGRRRCPIPGASACSLSSPVRWSWCRCIVARFLIGRAQTAHPRARRSASNNSRCCHAGSGSRSIRPRSACGNTISTTDKLVWDDRMNDLYGTPDDGQPRNYQHWKNALHPDDLDRAAAGIRRCRRDPRPLPLGVPLADCPTERERSHPRHRRLLPRDRRLVPHRRRELGRVSADVAIKQDLERANALTEARNAELVAATARIEHNRCMTR